MPLTSNLSTVTVSGTYVDIQGNPIAGQVGFTPRAVLTDTVANQIVVPKKVTVTLDINGSFSTTLPATDDTDLTPYNFTYYVEELFTGGRTYDINVPAGSSLNLADVAAAILSTGAGNTYITTSQYSTLNNQVQTMVAVVNTASAITSVVTTAQAAASAAAVSASSAATSADEYTRVLHHFVLMGV
jgi:hypothetical protein